MSKYKEKRRTKMILKRLKAEITKPEELTVEELKILHKYYPFLFHMSLSKWRLKSS